jgi:hypothetical protein
MNDSGTTSVVGRWGIVLLLVVVAGMLWLLSARFTCDPVTHVPAFSPAEDRAMREDLAERRGMGLAPPAPTTAPTTQP